MTRYRGHFLNWIDTRTLETLPPAYVSTVDSGNLAGSLIALKQGCLAMPQQTVGAGKRGRAWSICCSCSQRQCLHLRNRTRAHDEGDVGTGASTSLLLEHLSQIRHQVLAVRSDRAQWQPLLAQLVGEGQQAINQQLVDFLAANAGVLNSEVLQNCRIYTDRIQHHLDEMQHEADTLLPWLALLNAPPALFVQPALSPAAG